MAKRPSSKKKTHKAEVDPTPQASVELPASFCKIARGPDKKWRFSVTVPGVDHGTFRDLATSPEFHTVAECEVAVSEFFAAVADMGVVR